MKKTALIIEDDLLISLELEDILLDLGFDVVATAVREDDAVREAQRHRPDLLLVDYRLASGNGVDAVARLNDNELPAIVFVTASTEEVLKRIPDATHVGKPFSVEAIAAAVTSAMAKRG